MKAGQLKPGPRHTGTATRTMLRVVEPARALAERLEAAGAARDARILRQLLKSHGGQRSMLQQYAALPMKLRGK